MLLSGSAFCLLGGGYLQEMFIFWNMQYFFDKMFVTIDKIWYVFKFFGDEGLLVYFLLVDYRQLRKTKCR
jgi:uncharacterized membrane protein